MQPARQCKMFVAITVSWGVIKMAHAACGQEQSAWHAMLGSSQHNLDEQESVNIIHVAFYFSPFACWRGS